MLLRSADVGTTRDNGNPPLGHVYAAFAVSLRLHGCAELFIRVPALHDYSPGALYPSMSKFDATVLCGKLETLSCEFLLSWRVAASLS